MEEDLEILKDANPDAVIFSDMGVYNLIKRHIPDMPLHVSTQANTLNYEAVKFWQDLGAKRIILARELALKEIAEIRNKVPDIELEMFVQGAQCVSYSGRCLISNFMTNNERKSNQGFCAQPCRYKYYLVEETRLSEPYEIGEDEHGTYIMSPKDLALIKYLHEILETGVNSLKVEGRTKSMYYAANVAKTYRKALDSIKNGEPYNADALMEELKKVGNRGYTTGFSLGEVPEDEYKYESSKSSAGARFYAIINDKDENGFLTKMKYKLEKGEEIEIFNPRFQSKAKVTEIKDLFGNDLDVANTNQELYLKFTPVDWLENDYKMAIIRSTGE
jgi:putative protease